MDKMERLIEIIVAKLRKRQESILTLSCSEFEEGKRSVKDFVDHQYICLQGAGALQLARLAKLDCDDPLTRWLMKGLELGCDFTIKLGFSAICLVPKELLEWPICIQTNQDKFIHTIPSKVITFSDVALLTEYDVLVRFRHQQLTELAKEHLDKKKIQQIERL